MATYKTYIHIIAKHEFPLMSTNSQYVYFSKVYTYLDHLIASARCGFILWIKMYTSEKNCED